MNKFEIILTLLAKSGGHYYYLPGVILRIGDKLDSRVELDFVFLALIVVRTGAFGVDAVCFGVSLFPLRRNNH